MLNLRKGTKPLQTSLGEYEAAWKAFLVDNRLEQLEQIAVPTTLSLKVANKAELFRYLEDNAGNIEQVHIGTVNDRYIASAALKEPIDNLPILKILQRRPGSSDSLGLDSIDYLVKSTEEVFRLLQGAGATIEKQHNEVHAWLSLRFGSKKQYEAKFTDHVVLEVAIKELRMTIDKQFK
ncbi:MAG TPA: hypothetical protein VLG13_02245 [Patescibacteria group bacterium]|nr:hypothetical protein [Patescibacteria group bacterium]